LEFAHALGSFGVVFLSGGFLGLVTFKLWRLKAESY
jgi:hypothetical protein